MATGADVFCKDPERELAGACRRGRGAMPVPCHAMPCPPTSPLPQSHAWPSPQPAHTDSSSCRRTFARCCLLLRSLRLSVSVFFFKALEAVKNQKHFFLPFPLASWDDSERQPLAMLAFYLVLCVVWSRCQPACGSVQMLQGMVPRSLKIWAPRVRGSHVPAGPAPPLTFILLKKVVGHQMEAQWALPGCKPPWQ